MKLKMIDNAIDSLKLVMEYFYDYNINNKSKKDNTRLKLTIIFLHNSIELLLKSILINKNELLIYENLPSNKLDEYNKIKNSSNKTLSLDEFLIKKEGIKTINYTKLINTYCNTFNADKKTKIVLFNLGKLRNSVTHFGIDKSDDFEDMLITIYESINIILYVLYEKLEEIDDYFEYNDVKDILEPLVEGWERSIMYSHINIYGNKITKITDILNDILFSPKFNAFLETNGITFKTNKKKFFNHDISINFKHNDSMLNISNFYNPFHKCILLEDNEGGIYFVIDCEKDLLYCYNEDVEYKREPELYKQWEIDEKNNRCKKKKFTKENFEKELQKLLNHKNFYPEL
ncbi:hypothetical protein [Clostridioides difficile]|uniref:hypothetical protein n=1 Tax=Clostridioides difficile TaxID=1496 RepID=UPI000D1F8611|nr:hypothetical protein [Clostridioides difficile]MBY2508752.1 hypothetical protein [Clostridioides difficile]MDM9773659.1 hypothetical protein [Clostridioides difficile]HBF7477351.1 hypothetical protein [Clostridioides difficile]HBF9404135.1 hypothetical protein [Clostridioides difficile]